MYHTSLEKQCCNDSIFTEDSFNNALVAKSPQNMYLASGSNLIAQSIGQSKASWWTKLEQNTWTHSQSHSRLNGFLGVDKQLSNDLYRKQKNTEAIISMNQAQRTAHTRRKLDTKTNHRNASTLFPIALSLNSQHGQLQNSHHTLLWSNTLRYRTHRRTR